MSKYQGEKYPILEFFAYAHLPEHLREISIPFAELASAMQEKLTDSIRPAEAAAGFRKLLEAKDCFVRAALK